MGSGTTLVEILLAGGLGLGVDIDPLARLITQAKTERAPVGRVLSLGEELREHWRPAEHLFPPMPDVADFAHWFTRKAWGELAGLLDAIQHLECTDVERRFFLVVFSSILRWVSNADDQSQKTYVSGTLPKTPLPARETFWKSFSRAVAGLRSLDQLAEPQATVQILGDQDARRLDIGEGTVDLVVTSPPYLDSVDYMYNFMLEYFWLGPLLGIPTRRSFNQRRREYLGAKTPLSPGIALAPSIQDLVQEAQLPPGRALAASAYLAGMAQHFNSAARAMRPGARYVLVVGNSQTRTGILPVHDCLIRLAEDAGLRLEKAFAYRVRRHYMKFPRAGRGGIILIDWVIVLRKGGSGWEQPERLPLPWVTQRSDAVAH
jgi:hypothetical protein